MKVTTTDIVCPDCGADVGQWCWEEKWVKRFIGYWYDYDHGDTPIWRSVRVRSGVRAGHLLTHASRSVEINHDPESCESCETLVRHGFPDNEQVY